MPTELTISQESMKKNSMISKSMNKIAQLQKEKNDLKQGQELLENTAKLKKI